jgi:predicted tellurium resistance membrane protein TerC
VPSTGKLEPCLCFRAGVFSLVGKVFSWSFKFLKDFMKKDIILIAICLATFAYIGVLLAWRG